MHHRRRDWSAFGTQSDTLGASNRSRLPQFGPAVGDRVPKTTATFAGRYPARKTCCTRTRLLLEPDDPDLFQAGLPISHIRPAPVQLTLHAAPFPAVPPTIAGATNPVRIRSDFLSVLTGVDHYFVVGHIRSLGRSRRCRRHDKLPPVAAIRDCYARNETPLAPPRHPLCPYTLGPPSVQSRIALRFPPPSNPDPHQ